MKIQKFSSLKKILIALLLCISSIQSIAQNSNGIFFQAVARDNFSNPAKDRNIYVESSILQTTVNGTKVLVELHKTKTDAMGVFNITIGNGQRTGGSSTSIATIDWSKGPFYLNLKIAITPFSASDSWDYSKELVDIGTTSFGAVPFAFYSASSAKVSDKLDATDTTKMLAVYAKAMAVQSLATDVSTKLTAADTLTMLAPYAKAAYTIDSNFFRSQLATKLNITDTINYTKQKYTDSAFSKKLNIADSSSYVTPSKLAANLFDQTPLKNAIATKLNITDTINYTKQKYTDSAFSKKLNIADSSNYVTPTKLAANLFDQTPLKNAIATKLNIADSSSYVTPSKLASYYASSASSGTTVDTLSLSNRINLKASSSDVTNAIALNTSTIATNTNAITANTTAIAAEATTARAAELVLTNTLSSNTASISSNTVSITANTADIITNRANITTNTSSIATNATAITANTSAINTNTSAIAAEATTARAAELALTNSVSSNTASINTNTTSIDNLNSNIASNTSSITANTSDISTNRANIATNTTAITANANAIATNTSAISAEATTARAAELVLTNTLSSNTTNISSNTVSITANTADIITNRANINTNTSAINTNTTAIAAEATTARAAELVLTNSVSSNTASITSNTSAIAANTASIQTNTSDIALKAPIISPTFTGTPTAPTAEAGINTTQLATTAFVNNATLNINASSISGTVALSQGGTGQTTIAGIKSVLGLASSKVAIGATSGVTSQGSGAVAIGNGAGQTSQGANTIALGYVAGSDRQGASSIAIGVNAAQYTQGTNAVAIGDVAGQDRQGANAVAIGSNAGQTSQGANAVAIGGYSTSSFTNSIAIGYKATTTAANTIQLGGDGVVSGSTAITNVKTTGTLTAGTVTYPNAHNSTAGQLLSINATGTAAWTTPASSGGGTHTIGELYGGGIVFYVWDGGAHGLIASTDNLTGKFWGADGTLVSSTIYPLRDGIGAGRNNTERIIQNIKTSDNIFKSDYTLYAAYVCLTYQGGNYGDWYLPSKYELKLLYLQKSVIGWVSGNYWSSNDYATRDAYYLDFSTGLFVGMTKNYQGNGVRPIRSF
jgi:hypothetical protein